MLSNGCRESVMCVWQLALIAALAASKSVQCFFSGQPSFRLLIAKLSIRVCFFVALVFFYFSHRKSSHCSRIDGWLLKMYNWTWPYFCCPPSASRLAENRLCLCMALSHSLTHSARVAVSSSNSFFSFLMFALVNCSLPLLVLQHVRSCWRWYTIIKISLWFLHYMHRVRCIAIRKLHISRCKFVVFSNENPIALPLIQNSPSINYINCTLTARVFPMISKQSLLLPHLFPFSHHHRYPLLAREMSE